MILRSYSSQDFTGFGSASGITCLAASRIQFFYGYCTEGLRSFLAVPDQLLLQAKKSINVEVESNVNRFTSKPLFKKLRT